MKWTRSEQKWLRKHEPQSCYSDARKAWSAAVTQFGSAHELLRGALQIGAFKPRYPSSYYAPPIISMPGSFDSAEHFDSPEQMFKAGMRRDVKAWEQLLIAAQSPRGSCLR